MSIRTAVAGAAIIVASYAPPAIAQNATFTEIRDAVPLKYFDAGTTVVQQDAPNTVTLVIGFNANDAFSASGELGPRLAADTLSFVVNAPPGHYISSITCRLSGRGAVNPPADARAAANWVINGQPADLGSFGGFPLLSEEWVAQQEATFTDPGMTSVPVSLTAQLFAFAPNALASAEVNLTSATIVVTVASSTASPR